MAIAHLLLIKYIIIYLFFQLHVVFSNRATLRAHGNKIHNVRILPHECTICEKGNY